MFRKAAVLRVEEKGGTKAIQVAILSLSFVFNTLALYFVSIRASVLDDCITSQ